jgi:anaerobic ribonucleoside-triphosphate reductase
VLKDIIILGFTVPEIDSLLEYYAEKTYNKIFNQEYEEIFNNEMKIVEIESKYENIDHNSKEYEIKVENAKTKAMTVAKEKAFTKTQRECEQGVQGIEYKLNTVASSRGDYPFTTFTFGLCKSELGKMISKTILNVRRKGQGKKGFKIPVLFPINLGHILVIV